MERFIVTLTKDEREELLAQLKTGKVSANKLMRARVLLALDKNNFSDKKQTDIAIAEAEHISTKTIYRIRQRFVEDGLNAALSRRPHPNPKSRKLDGDQEAHLLAVCCSEPPEGQSRWTLRLLADKLVEMDVVESISRTTLHRTLKKMN